MINQKFNRLTILRFAGKDKWGSLMVECRCDCSKILITRLADIKVNKSIQCRDCGYKLKRQSIAKLQSPIAGKGNNYRHGMAKTNTYKVWCGMKKRCSASTGKDFKWYKSRNITVCDRWLKFENFLEDMGEKTPKMYIDRIDNDLGYFKENCRWVNSKLNSQNRRCVKKTIIK